MSQAIDIIHAEHRAINEVLSAMETALGQIEGGAGRPDLELLFTAVYYLRLFPARLHHPKEERYLFAPLARRSAEAQTVIERLMAEHAAGDDTLATIERALEYYDRHYPDGREALERAVQDYLEIERTHMQREEGVLMPLAVKALTSDDWADIDDAFAKNAGSLFTYDLAVGFESLRKRIVDMESAARHAA